MNFFKQFRRTLAWRPLIATRALYWHLTRRRVRAGNTLRLAARTAPYFYEVWQEEIEDNAGVATSARVQVETWDVIPKIAVVGEAAPDSRLRADIAEQCFPPVDYCVWSENGLAELLRAQHVSHILFVEEGVRLPPTAVYHFAEAIRSNPEAAAIYGDTDEYDRAGKRHSPWLKPDWNREMYLAQDYVSASSVLSVTALGEALERFSVPPSINWAGAVAAVVAQEKARVVHVPRITAHLAGAPTQNQRNAQRNAVLHGILQELDASLGDGPFGTSRVFWPLPPREQLPLVSIIVPTRDRADLLRTCMESLRRKTSYANYEIIVVDNGSSEPLALDYLAWLEQSGTARVLRDPSPYNFSQLNNRAARQARGELLCLLNNDTEVFDGAWLEEMVRQAIRPEIGAVGAKLLYPDGRLQHAGVVVGLGQAAGHAHRFTPSDAPGYFLQSHIARYVSAVTAACLVISRAKFEQVGGLDEENFAVAYNDVDFCLRLQQAGWHNVYTPHAVLIHHESVSRGDDFSAEHSPRYRRELDALQKRWSTIESVDPYHHPRLDRSDETFALSLW